MEVRWSRAGGVFVDVKRRGPSRREILRQDAVAGCALLAARWDHITLREGTRFGIISSALGRCCGCLGLRLTRVYEHNENDC